MPVPLKQDYDLHDCTIHRGVAQWNAIEIDGKIEHRRRIEPSGQQPESTLFAAQRSVIRSICSGYRAPCTVICEAMLSISRRSSDVSSMATAPMFSSRRESLRV